MIGEHNLRVTSCTMINLLETYSWGPAIHAEYVLQHVVSGRGYFVTNGKKYEVKAGETFIIIPGQIVHYYPEPLDPWKYIWVNFLGSEVEGLLSLTGFLDFPVAPASHELTEIYNGFCNNVQLNHVQLSNAGLLRILLSRYITLYPARSSKSTVNYLHLAKKHIASNSYRHSFNIAELSQAVGIERSYLYRLFMEGEGISPTEYLINYRLDRALQMMKDGFTQIKLISYSVGYENPLYFSNCFKKKYGMSPKNYIKKELR